MTKPISILNTRSLYKPGGLSGVGQTIAVAAGQLRSCWSTLGAEGG